MERLRLGVFKLASCDGCQLSVLACVDALLAVADRLEVVYFPEIMRRPLRGQLDVALVEGSVSTAAQVEEVRRVRERTRLLVTLGACAHAGGVQALRNLADGRAMLRAVYARPEYVASLARSTPVADHVAVDYELRGCPPSPAQVAQVLAACLDGRLPRLRDEPVCAECKRAGAACVLVAHGTPCAGPVTHAGCGALCPRQGRGCYACFGPAPDAEVPALIARLEAVGMPRAAAVRLLQTINAWAPAFRDADAGGRAPHTTRAGHGR